MASAPDCLTVFESAPENKERADHIDQRAPDRACQDKIVSKHCSECVQDAEILVRIVIDDTHVKREDNVLRLRSTFMNDACSFGSSSLRLGRATREEFEITLQEMLNDNTPLKADGTPRSLIGYVKIPASVARLAKITQEFGEGNGKKRHVVIEGFGVYATGLEQRPNHADIFCIASHQGKAFTKSARNRAAQKLTELIAANFVQTDDVNHVLALGRTPEKS